MGDFLTKHLFKIGKHTEQAHDYVSALINEAYKRISDEKPTTPQERVSKAEELTEAYYAQLGLQPAESVLSRLAWYLVFDDMTDSHPDKMTREEYPIMSEHQSGVRRKREYTLSDIYTGKNDETIGRYSDSEGIKRRVYDYMTPERDDYVIDTKYLDLYSAIDNAGLTARQREAIDLVYFEDMTQEDAGRAMGVNKSNVNEYIRYGLAKIRRKMTQTS